MATTGLGAGGFLKRIGVNAALRLSTARPTAIGFAPPRPRSATARFSGPRSATARFSGPRSAAAPFTGNLSATVRFAALYPAARTPRFGVQTGCRLLPLRCATDAPPPSPPADALPTSPDTPPPLPPTTSRLKRVLYALKPGYSLVMLAVALGIGAIACRDEARVSWAAYVVMLCEKTEKVHKVLTHILPLLVAIVKSFL